jgi:outer membrane receptor protein involved in Fe transport
MSMPLLNVIVAACLTLLSQGRTVTGMITDPSGGTIPRAAVVVTVSGSPPVSTTTDAFGQFALAVSTCQFEVVASAQGFEPVRLVFSAFPSLPLRIVLIPAASASVTVTAGRTEQRLIDVAATVSVVDRTRIDRSPAMTTDDVLRQVPAFSLFRRSSSVAAHPTAQGVSLRGIGPSGVSRTLVLLDGVPFNDPFGGWVSWTRVPRSSIDRIEIAEGSAANLFGNFAMGGAINLVTAIPSRPYVDMRVQYGEDRTWRVDGSAAVTSGSWTALLDAGRFRTDGYGVVAEAERGPVDENVAVESWRVYGAASSRLFAGSTVRARADLYDESRRNGKRSTVDGTPEANGTEWRSAALTSRTVQGANEIRVNLLGDWVRFDSNFLAVPAANPPRSIGRVTLNQFVPSTSVGAGAQWMRAAGSRYVLMAGADWRAVEGESREDALDPQTGTRVVLHRTSGGAQNSAGAFAQAIVTPLTRLVVTVGLRHDYWRNADGHSRETDVAGAPTPNNRSSLASRSDAVTSPRLSALFKPTGFMNAWTAVGWSFRAPTPNELYRQFRVGAVLTLANEALGPERLRTIEAGVRLTPVKPLSVRATAFDNALRDAISNVAITTSDASVTQQRQNLGLTRIRGFEADAEWRPVAGVSLTAGYIYNHAVVREFSANNALVGKRLPQVPRHRATAQLWLNQHRLGELALSVQAYGRQYDDDLNVRTVPGEDEPGLPPATSVDLWTSRRLGRGLSAFAGAQNLFGRRPAAGTLPTTLAAPRMISVGLQWRPPLRRR